MCPSEYYDTRLPYMIRMMNKSEILGLSRFHSFWDSILGESLNILGQDWTLHRVKSDLPIFNRQSNNPHTKDFSISGVHGQTVIA